MRRRFEVFDNGTDAFAHWQYGWYQTLGFIDVDWPFWDPKDTDGACRAPVSLNLKSTAEESKTTVTGQLTCDLVWCPAGSTPRLQSKESIPIARKFEEDAARAMRLGTLLVTVKAASNLLNKDWGPQGKSDPYVVVTVPSGAKAPHTAKTKYITGTETIPRYGSRAQIVSCMISYNFI